jgi:hypothetical protein
MKNIFFILIIALAVQLYPLNVNKANDEKTRFMLVRLDYNNTSGEKGVTYFDYNEK